MPRFQTFLAPQRVRGLQTCLAAIVGAVVLSLAACEKSPLSDDGLAAAVTPETLLSSAPGIRPIVGQLTGGGYSACQNVEDDLLPAAVCSSAPGRDRHLGEALRLYRRTGGKYVPQDDYATRLYLEGLAQLLWGAFGLDDPSNGPGARALDSSFLNRAIAAFERAAALNPDAATILSDLAAALIARAQIEEDPLDLLRAVEATGQALVLDPCLRPAYFNRGLALASLGASSVAAEAFDSYLSPAGCGDSRLDAAWTREAAERRDRLEWPGSRALSAADERALRHASLVGDQRVVESLVRHFGGEVTRVVEEGLFVEWGFMVSRDTSDSGAKTSADHVRPDQLLDAIGLIGGVLDVQLDEQVVSGAASAILRRQGTSTYRVLAGAHHAIASVPGRCDRETVERSISALVSARELLERHGSPFAGWAQVAEAICYYYTEEYRLSLHALIAVQTSQPQRMHSRLGARSARLQALLHYHLGEYPAALVAYRRAAAIANEIGEVQEEARALTGIAETAEQLGLYRDSWIAHFQALRLVPKIADDGTVYIVFSGAASLALRTGRLHLATPLRRQASEGGFRSRSTGIQVQAAIQDARLEAELGRSEAALERLRETMEKAVDSGSSGLVADVDRAIAEVLAVSDPEQALFAYDRAIAADQKTGYAPALMRAWLASAQIQTASGGLAEADLALDQAERLVVAQRELLDRLSLDERTAFATTVRDLADQRILLEAVGRGSAEAAFFAAERSTAEALGDWLGGGVAGPLPTFASRSPFLEPLPAADVERSLGAGTRLAVFRVLPERTLVWCVDDRGFRAPPPVELHRTDLDHRISAWVHELRSGPDRSRRERNQAGELARLLLQPCGYLEPGVEQLAIVPDGPLHGLPFAALVRPEDGLRLAETAELVIAPSVASYLAAVRSLRARPADDTTLVTVFAYDGAASEEMPLAWVDEEAERIVAAYGQHGRVRSFVGPKATADLFREWVVKSDVLHVAAHAFGDELAPSRARLELAPGSGAAGRVEIAEILTLHPVRTRVVVLSACSTADPSAASRGGASTLALSFLAAGVPSVIGSLWAVDDSEWTVEMAGEVHAGLAEGLQPSKSLARAQRRLLSRGAPTRTWAVFQVYGAGAVD